MLMKNQHHHPRACVAAWTLSRRKSRQLKIKTVENQNRRMTSAAYR